MSPRKSLSSPSPRLELNVCYKCLIRYWMLSGSTPVQSYSFLTSKENGDITSLIFIVTVAILSCKYNVSSEKNNLVPIYLGLKDFEKCLSCEEIEGNHKLQLKVS